MTPTKPSASPPPQIKEITFEQLVEEELSGEYPVGDPFKAELGSHDSGLHETEETSAPAAPPPVDARVIRKRVIDSLLAAVEMAALKQIKDTDTIRYLLRSWYKDFFKDNTVDLTLFHRAMNGEEGMTPDDAAMPCLIYLAARGAHGYEVKLPQEVESRPDLKAMLTKAERQIAIRGGFQRLFEEVQARTPPPDPAEASLVVKYDRPQGSVARGKQAVKAFVKKVKRQGIAFTPARAAAAGLGIALSFAAIVGAVLLSNTQQWGTPIDLAPLRPILELADGMRTEATLAAKITDSRWSALPQDQRRIAVEKLTSKLAAQGIQRVVLCTAENPLAVIAQAPSAPNRTEWEVVIKDQLAEVPVPQIPTGEKKAAVTPTRAQRSPK